MNTRALASHSLVSLVLALGAIGCGGENDPSLFEQDELAFTDLNGLSENGLDTNGLNTNGLNVNGLNVNGLAINVDFAHWFEVNTANRTKTMKYLVACGLPAGKSFVYNGITFPGKFGLASSWQTSPLTSTQIRWVTACLLAHVNADGRNVVVSFRGPTGALATTSTERSAYPKEEGAYFGNVLAGTQRKYSCKGAYASYSASTYGRRCASSCSSCEYVSVGNCSSVCSSRTTDGGWSNCRGSDGLTYANVVTSYVK
jgi:hypothetical protein